MTSAIEFIKRFVRVLETPAAIYTLGFAIFILPIVFAYIFDTSLIDTKVSSALIGYTVIGGILSVFWVKVTEQYYRSKRESDTKKLEAIVKQISDVHETDQFSTIESKKAIATDSLFETNRTRSFRLVKLRCMNTRFFCDYDWLFSKEFNLLLGKNGFGKSYILHALAGLTSDNYSALAAMFPKGEYSPNLSLVVEYQRFDDTPSVGTMGSTEILFNYDGLKTRLGPIPLLAVPDLRFIDKSTVKFGFVGNADVVRGGSSLFLADQPIEGLVQTMLYQLCFDYLEQRRLDLPSIVMLQRVISKLSESEFRFHSIRRAGPAQFEINVIAEGLANYPMPLQRASQGTLSVVALFGLIERFLRELYYAKPSEDVCKRSAIVIIDELDAHLHPSWQRKIVGLLRETFPNVQFIASAHSPLVVGGRLENEVAVLRKAPDGRFTVELQLIDFMGKDIDSIIRSIFESDPIDETVGKYLARQPVRMKLEARVDQLKTSAGLSPAEEIELANAITELDRMAKAEEHFKSRMQSEDLEQSWQALKVRNNFLEQQLAALQKASELKPDKKHGSANVA